MDLNFDGDQVWLAVPGGIRLAMVNTELLLAHDVIDNDAFFDRAWSRIE